MSFSFTSPTNSVIGIFTSPSYLLPSWVTKYVRESFVNNSWMLQCSWRVLIPFVSVCSTIQGQEFLQIVLLLVSFVYVCSWWNPWYLLPLRPISPMFRSSWTLLPRLTRNFRVILRWSMFSFRGPSCFRLRTPSCRVVPFSSVDFCVSKQVCRHTRTPVDVSSTSIWVWNRISSFRYEYPTEPLPSPPSTRKEFPVSHP